jgi:hypothetical protein
VAGAEKKLLREIDKGRADERAFAKEVIAKMKKEDVDLVDPRAEEAPRGRH